jgi:hypothetical protein
MNVRGAGAFGKDRRGKLPARVAVMQVVSTKKSPGTFS